MAKLIMVAVVFGAPVALIFAMGLQVQVVDTLVSIVSALVGLV